MSVDPFKPRKILVVHGVQSGRDEDINSHEIIKELIMDRLDGLQVAFEAEMYRYENINDKAQKKLKKALNGFLNKLIAKIPFGSLLGTILDKGVDIVGDVLLELKAGSTCQIIRQGLMDRIEQIYNEGNALYIVAHSLGSIYAFDTVNKLMTKDEYFDPNSRRTWPVQALVTMGSPIGLSMFKRSGVENLGNGRHFFRWINYWARTDPVVSGSFYGKPYEGYQIAERFIAGNSESGWFIQDRVLDLGKTWLMAHTGYWRNAGIGDDLVTLITS